MPISLPKGVLSLSLDRIDEFPANTKTGLPVAVGNMPDIPALQDGQATPNNPAKESGGNYVDENGRYLPRKGSDLDIAINIPVQTYTNSDLEALGNPTHNPESTQVALDSRKTGVSYILKSIPSSPGNLIVDKMKIFNAFLDYSGKQFTHGLDYLQGGISTKSFLLDSNSVNNLAKPNKGDIFMGSFVTTRVENEDPTYLGYDIVIKEDTSPLFNGELLAFLQRYRGYTELGSRISVYQDFLLHIRRFMNYDMAKVGEIMVTDKGKKNAAPINTYYLTKLSGLKNLVEKTQSDSAKYFPEYPKDKISLTFRENVQQDIGYLASLYKTLSWSRINGKQIIPENLLRFDCDIIISEVRKYNRVAKSSGGDKLDIFKDNISKYVYTLYECQFYFDDMPHGDDLDMSKVDMVESYPIDINYKFSTMKFEKFEYSVGRKEFDKKVLNNRLTDVTKILPTDQDARFSINQQTGEIEISSSALPQFNTSPTKPVFESGSIDALKYKQVAPSLPETRPLPLASPFTNLKRDIKRAFVNEINRRISRQIGLLFKTVENLRRRIPFAGQLDEPTNVYSERGQFENDLINAGRNFVGSSLKVLFGDQDVTGNLPTLGKGGR